MGDTRRCRPARLRQQEHGFTIVELLGAMAVSIVIILAALSLLDMASPNAARELRRQASVADGRAGIERMVRELRNADTINSTSSTVVDFNAPTATGEQRIVYECHPASQVVPYRNCLRYSGVVGSALGPSTLVIDRLLNATTSQPVFTYLPDRIRPTEIRVQVVVPTSSGENPGYSHRLSLFDSAFMRNLDLSGS